MSFRAVMFLGAFTFNAPKYLLYVDESGDPLGWRDQTHFILGAIAVHEGQVNTISRKLDEIQRIVFPETGSGIDIGFHASRIHEGKEHFKRLTRSKREELLTTIYGTMASIPFPHAILFGTAIHMSAVEEPENVVRNTFMDIVSRFNIFLKRQHMAGHTNKGLLIIDGAHQERYRSALSSFKKQGTEYGKIDNIIDIPYFARQDHTRMIQLADFCAYSLWRYYENGDVSYLKMIEHKFDRRGPAESPDGLNHIIKEKCKCVACSWRSGSQCEQQPSL